MVAPIWFFEPNTFNTQTFDTLKQKAIIRWKNRSVIGKVDAILVLQTKPQKVDFGRWYRCNQLQEDTSNHLKEAIFN
jgi:hypothetical protein